jgi:hypothetical protein
MLATAAYQWQMQIARSVGGNVPVLREGADEQDQDIGVGEEMTSAEGRRNARATLTIAQHEWRKVLDGTKGHEVRRPILPTTDAISNSEWGDKCGAKEGNVFRIYVQNVNGLTLDRRGGQYDT